MPIVAKLFVSFLMLAAGFLTGQARADDIWTKGYLWNAAANSGSDVWYGPGNTVELNGVIARGKNAGWIAENGVIKGTETGAVALRDGRIATLAVTRAASIANVWTGVRAAGAAVGALAGSPLGFAALALELGPPLLNWIAGDNGAHIRLDPVAGGLQKTNSLICSVAPCYQYQQFGPNYDTSVWYGSAQEACQGSFPRYTPPLAFMGMVPGQPNNCYFNVVDADHRLGPSVLRSVAIQPAGWLPASMDDIAPYMTSRLPPAALLPAILAAGIPVSVDPVSVTGPNPALPDIPPYVSTWDYPKPADKVSVSTTPGNPLGLPNNTPKVTNTSSSSASISPGGHTTSGPDVSNQAASPTPAPLSTPTTSSTTSIYDPATDKTTSTTTTTQDGARSVGTTNTTTTVSNTTNSSTVNNTFITTTNYVNTTTNTQLQPPKTDSKTDPEKDTATDSALPDQPKLYTRKYPDGLTGVWTTQKAALLATPLLALTGSMMPTIANASGYPVFIVPVVIGPWNFGTYDVSPAGYVWDFIKVVVIVSALFLCRALMFGG